MPVTRHPMIRVGSFAILAIIFVVAVCNWRVPVVRMTSPLADAIVFIVILLVPLLMIALAFTFKRVWVTTLLMIGLGPIGAGSGLLALLTLLHAAMIVSDGVDASFERIKQETHGKTILSTYRTNGGAMTSYGIVVRQERVLLPGLLLVRNLAKKYPAQTASILTKDGKHVTVSIPHTITGVEDKHVRHLKDFVYF